MFIDPYQTEAHSVSHPEHGKVASYIWVPDDLTDPYPINGSLVWDLINLHSFPDLDIVFYGTQIGKVKPAEMKKGRSDGLIIIARATRDEYEVVKENLEFLSDYKVTTLRTHNGQSEGDSVPIGNLSLVRSSNNEVENPH